MSSENKFTPVGDTTDFTEEEFLSLRDDMLKSHWFFRPDRIFVSAPQYRAFHETRIEVEYENSRDPYRWAMEMFNLRSISHPS